jgi:hypothetical protein
MFVVGLARVPYFEIVYIRDKIPPGAPPPDNASNHVLEDIVRRLASACTSLRLLGLETLDRGLTFWRVEQRNDGSRAVVTLLSRASGEGLRDNFLSGAAGGTTT